MESGSRTTELLQETAGGKFVHARDNHGPAAHLFFDNHVQTVRSSCYSPVMCRENPVALDAGCIVIFDKGSGFCTPGSRSPVSGGSRAGT